MFLLLLHGFLYFRLVVFPVAVPSTPWIVAHVIVLESCGNGEFSILYNLQTISISVYNRIDETENSLLDYSPILTEVAVLFACRTYQGRNISILIV